ncbi:MAG: hypoxanthine phosphoribosyltransferase [Actinobacteria bacterium]|nr:hypoxanthine phosphoribosyltransferase [Actinomycetota bacterium]
MTEENHQKNIKSSEILGRILFPGREIQKRVRELGNKITHDYYGKELVLICILRGAVVFLTDLIKHIDLPLSIDFMSISSYGFNETDSGLVKITKDLDENIEGKNVLIVEDIIDTGLTLSYMIRNLQLRNPASIEICTLIDREVRRIASLKIKYSAFKLEEKYVVGYGLDYKQKYRNLESIYELKTDTVKKDIESLKSSLNK